MRSTRKNPSKSDPHQPTANFDWSAEASGVHTGSAEHGIAPAGERGLESREHMETDSERAISARAEAAAEASRGALMRQMAPREEAAVTTEVESVDMIRGSPAGPGRSVIGDIIHASLISEMATAESSDVETEGEED